MEYLNLTRAAHLLASLTGNPSVTDDVQAIIEAGAQGEIPIYWRNSEQIWTRLSDFKIDIKGADSASRHMQLQPHDVAKLETAQQVDVLSFELTDQDIALLQRSQPQEPPGTGGEVFIGEPGYRHALDHQPVTITRDQLRVRTDDLKAYAATLAPNKVVDAPAQASAAFKQVQPATWHLREPIRDDGLAQPLYLKLKEYRDAGKKTPTPRQVLSDWSTSPPPEITAVTKTGLKYIPTGKGSGSEGIPGLQKRIDYWTTLKIKKTAV